MPPSFASQALNLELRLRPEGSDGGHNGLKHINETLGRQNYARLRMGIGNAFLKGQQINYVLGLFDEDEKTSSRNCSAARRK
jgi:peptidyl-tRNA hydrolase